jgi:hypothetical protein
MGVDKLIGWVALFCMGFLLGQINAPEPKQLPCVKKASPVMYESRGDVKYWRDYTRSLPK